LGITAKIKLVAGAKQNTISLNEVKDLLNRYIDWKKRTSELVSFQAGKSSYFPYEIKEKPEAEGKWFYLKGDGVDYRFINFGVGVDDGISFIEIALPDNYTHGDLAKGNEFAKYFGELLKAEVHLFNERVMYFNPRK